MKLEALYRGLRWEEMRDLLPSIASGAQHNVDVELRVLGGHFYYELYFGSHFGEYKEKFGWSVVLDSAVSNPVIELFEEQLKNINISGIHVIAVKQYDREDFDPPKKQVNICFYSDEAETLHSQQMEYLRKRDDEEGFEADEYRKRQALGATLKKTNYTLTREAIEKCVLNTPFCGGEIGDFDINVETTSQRMFKDTVDRKSLQIQCRPKIRATVK